MDTGKKSAGRAKMHGILSTILNEHARTRVNGRVASDRTTSAYGEVLRKCFNDLHELGYCIENPRNLTEGHVKALCQKWMSEGKKTSTMQETLSKLRTFGKWIGKPEMVKSLHHYLPDIPKKDLKVKRIAIQSKSWTENGVDVAEKIRQADAIDERFGLMLRIMVSFGLRRKEVCHTRVWKADRGDKLVVYPGEAKNGRPRDIYIDTIEQRQVLDYVKAKMGKNEHLGWLITMRGKRATLKYNYGRYNRSMAKIGITKEDALVTGHGLRAQYAENAALVAGLLMPTLGGSGGQMDRETRKVISGQLSELLGHTRESIMGPYGGSFGRNAPMDPANQCQRNIEKALPHCHSGVTTAVAEDRIEDCKKLVAEMEAIGVEITMRQAQLLWEIHSQRHARHWVKADKGIVKAMEAAAIRLVRHLEAKESKAA